VCWDGPNEKITSGTKIYLGYMARVPMEKKNLSHKKKPSQEKINMREEKTKTEVYRNIPTD